MLKDNGWLKDMALYGRKARELSVGFDRDTFLADTRTHLAVIHTLVIVGEAAAQVSEEVRVKLPEIPWGAIVGMRNKLVHHYFKADLEVVWKTVESNLPSMIDAIEQYLAGHPPPPEP
jgi:uncharacterized protein with HEPN domain